MVGQNFQGWRIEESIGEGAFGKVYRIVRDEFGHTYEAALKVIDIPQSQSEVNSFKNEGMTDENVTTYFHDMVEKIVEEFALMSRLKGNSNIVSYEDHVVEKKKDEFGWRIYIRMELLTPLFSYVKKHGLSEQDVIKLGIDICRSLELCRKNNIIHRDIKPENIFISPSGDFKLGDFGIARELEKTSAGLSKVGTKNYMAPEIYKGFEYNSTVDIYSLGIVLYRFLNDNRLPFMPPAPQPIKYSDQEMASTMRLSGQTMPKPANTSEELSKIVLKACAYLPEERFALARDMRKELEKIRLEESDEEIVPNTGTDRKVLKEFSATEPKVEEQTGRESVESEEDNDNKTMMLFDSQTMMLRQKETSSSVSKIDENIEQEPVVEKVTNEKYLEDKKIIRNENTPKKSKKKYVLLGVCCILLFGIGILGINSMVKKENVAKKDEIEIADVSTVEASKKTASNPVETKAPVEMISVPELKDMTKKEVESKLTEYKLSVGYDKKEYSDSVKKDQVISQNPDAGTSVEIGTKVIVVLSKGVKKISVPSVKGLSLSKAKSKLKAKGLKCKVKREYSSLVSKGRVYAQSIKAKTKVKKNKTVVIYVSKGVKSVPKPVTPSYSDNYSYTPTPSPSPTKKPAEEKSDGTFTDDKKEKSDGTFS